MTPEWYAEEFMNRFDMKTNLIGMIKEVQEKAFQAGLAKQFEIQQIREKKADAEGYARGVEASAVVAFDSCEHVQSKRICVCAREIRKLQCGQQDVK